MSLNQIKMKLLKNKEPVDIGSPQYSLRYRARFDNPRDISYPILSALIGNADVIVMLNSGLFQNAWQGDVHPIEKFLNRIRQLELFHTYRKTPQEKNLSFFGFQTQRKKKVDVEEIAVYVPNQVWRESFREILPLCGARYLVTKAPMSVSTFMNGILGLSEEEISTMFSICIFDLAPVGQMGISSKQLDQKQIALCLGL
ncbi:MAG: hypothetical protein GX144_01600 [Clostridiaceae bacterium]|nr:hypothetical protein [Clostridiaceae bacterium]